MECNITHYLKTIRQLFNAYERKKSPACSLCFKVMATIQLCNAEQGTWTSFDCKMLIWSLIGVVFTIYSTLYC